MDRNGKPRVYVIVLSWNRREDTLACLRSVLDSDYPSQRLLLVDNASTDGTITAVREQFPGLETLVNERNLGFARGCNAGLRYTLERGADYVLLLNNDTLVDSAMLSYLAQAAEEDPLRGPLGPRIFFLEEPTRIWSEGAYCRPLTKAWYGHHHGLLAKDLPPPAAIRPVDYVTGCAMLLSRQFLDRVGLFDPEFFFYYEDLDLCLRAKKAGFQPVCVPQAQIWHRVSASAGPGSPQQRYHLARSSVRFYRKHTPPPLLPLILLWRLGSATKAVAQYLWWGKREAAWSYLRGLHHGLRDLPPP
jgi:GT2 family glycosyltransferase